MPSNLSVNLNLAGEGSISGTPGLTTPKSTLTIGAGSWGPMALALTYGPAGSNKIKQWYQAQRTLAAGANDDLDLSGVLSNELGESVLFTAIKLLLVAIVAPDGIKKLRIGPQNQSQSMQGPWGGTGASNLLELDNWCPVINHPFDGYPVTAGTGDKVRINNPSAVDVTYNLLIAGQTA